MDDSKTLATLGSFDALVTGYQESLDDHTALLRTSVRDSCGPLQDEVSLRVTASEVQLTRATTLITQSAEYHLMRAYFYASPSLIAIITAIIGVVKTVITVVKFLSDLLRVVTGEDLAYWLDQIIPGFQDAWNDIMNKVSQFSSLLGWGVDGVHHLLNIRDASVDLWGQLTGKDLATARLEKYKRTDALLTDYTVHLALWQSNPGQQINRWVEGSSEDKYWEGVNKIRDFTDKITTFGEKAEGALTSIGTMTGELLAIRNDMPAFIAEHIPQALWDALERVDTAVNDRILPFLTKITDRLDELDAVLEAHRKKAAELADKIAHPGDMLHAVFSLEPDVKMDQFKKIDGVTSELFRYQNEQDFVAIEPNLREFGKIAEALSYAPPPLTFMELELPGRSPGIVAEPRESWVVTGGDY